MVRCSTIIVKYNEFLFYITSFTGRYAKVYEAGEIHGVKVAIKCFTAAHRKMWQQERDIYKTPGMASNHNIARFYGSTQQGSGNEMTMWIVVQYYPNGSICDYLKGNVLLRSLLWLPSAGSVSCIVLILLLFLVAWC